MKKLSVYSFPKDETEKQAWIAAIPNANLVVTKHTVVCELHWPTGFETISVKGCQRPKNPPSVWPNVPSSQIPTPIAPSRQTKRASCSQRNQQEDQLAAFLEKDNATFLEMKEKLLANERDLPAAVIAFMDDDILRVLSKRFLNGVPLFVINISEDRTFENFHLGVRCHVKSLSKSRIDRLTSWAALEENIRYLNSMNISQKKEVILQQLQVMGTAKVGKTVYTPDVIIRAFQYFATSRCIYERLRNDFQFPDVSTLRKITSKVAKAGEAAFSNAVFGALEERQKLCILLLDEVYVKKMMLYHGGEVFGRSLDNPECLAKTMLGIMVVANRLRR